MISSECLIEGVMLKIPSYRNRLGFITMAVLVSLQVVLQKMELRVKQLGVMQKVLKRRGWSLRVEAKLVLTFEVLRHIKPFFNNELYCLEL